MLTCRGAAKIYKTDQKAIEDALPGYLEEIVCAIDSMIMSREVNRSGVYRAYGSWMLKVIETDFIPVLDLIHTVSDYYKCKGFDVEVNIAMRQDNHSIDISGWTRYEGD